MSKMQERSNSESRTSKQIGRKNPTLLLQFVLPLFCLAVVGLVIMPSLNQASASFTVTMRVKDVNSDSPTVKATVKLDNGEKMSKKVDLGKKADKADWDVVDINFFFSNDKKVKIGTGFNACLGDDCEKGVNGPEHKPEVVKFTAPK